MSSHLFIIHFPIALILAGAVIDLVGIALGDREVRGWGGILLMAGGVAAFLAFATGEGARMAAIGTGEIDLVRMEVHQQWGSVGAWVLLLIAFLRALWRRRLEGVHGWLNLGLATIAVVVVIATTVTGTLVRHG